MVLLGKSHKGAGPSLANPASAKVGRFRQFVYRDPLVPNQNTRALPHQEPVPRLGHDPQRLDQLQVAFAGRQEMGRVLLEQRVPAERGVVQAEARVFAAELVRKRAEPRRLPLS